MASRHHKKSFRHTKIREFCLFLKRNTGVTWSIIIPVSKALTGGASDFPQPPRPQGRKLSLDRDVYYFENNRREEVVAYDNQSAKAQVCGKSFSPKINCPNPI